MDPGPVGIMEKVESGGHDQLSGHGLSGMPHGRVRQGFGKDEGAEVGGMLGALRPG